MSQKYRTRTILNWSLFSGMAYVVIRVIALCIGIPGALYSSQYPIITAVSAVVHIIAHQYYIVLIGLLVVLWMRISFLWYKGSVAKERLMKILVYSALIFINVLSFVSLFVGAVAQLVQKKNMKHPIAFRILYQGITPVGLATACILLTILAITLGIRVVYMMNQSATKGKKNEQEANRQKAAMIKAGITMLCLFIATNIRTAGLFMVFAELPIYTWTLLTRAISDLFGLCSIAFLFWPFRIGQLLEPLANLIHNTDGSVTEATEMEGYDEVPQTPTSPATPVSAMLETLEQTEGTNNQKDVDQQQQEVTTIDSTTTEVKEEPTIEAKTVQFEETDR
jgi:hypothetical protein